jgi:hypothetical protein
MDLDIDHNFKRVIGDLIDTTNPGDIIRYICPTGKTAVFYGGICIQTAAATIKLSYSANILYDLDSFTVTTLKVHKGFDFPIILMPTDSIVYKVTAGLAGVANAVLFIEEHSLAV